MVYVLPLNRGLHAVVDDDDAERVSAYRWHANEVRPGAFYAATMIRGRRVYLHRFLLSAPRGFPVDHANGDTLDNRRANLRVATFQQNAANSRRPERLVTRFRGVYAEGARWRAQIGVNGRDQYLGTFDTPEEAARVYDRAAAAAFGAFARLNFPASPPPEVLPAHGAFA